MCTDMGSVKRDPVVMGAAVAVTEPRHGQRRVGGRSNHRLAEARGPYLQVRMDLLLEDWAEPSTRDRQALAGRVTHRACQRRLLLLLVWWRPPRQQLEAFQTGLDRRATRKPLGGIATAYEAGSPHKGACAKVI